MEFFVESLDAPLPSFTKKNPETLRPSASSSASAEGWDDIIDLSKIDFRDDENWLVECPHNTEIDLQRWLYGQDEDGDLKSNLKNIDTRTFTRPKKRFTRPSIEKYNEELYGDLRELTDSGIQINGCVQEEKPLHFDLTQPSASVYFENILANAPMLDSFQNMSPPSLVNSMCSSTFANLMENSFIKNDPVLREIRDTDYTGSILQQENEAMSQSVTESCSSLNSDTLENILKTVSLDEKNVTRVINENNDGTFIKEDVNPIDEGRGDFETIAKEALNRTYQQTPVEIINSTITLDKRWKSDEKPNQNVKRLLDRRPSPSMDLNRLSYVVDNKTQQNSTLIKGNSFGSTDSVENADYMSLSSGSSKSSNKRTSLDGINMIAEMQEQSLRQVMSTPKTTLHERSWPIDELSPISRNSNPELSSNPLQKPVIAFPNAITKQKSVSHINQKLSKKADQAKTIRGSHPNLKMPEPRRPSNLNSMGHTLKGSYTSLKPLNPNLPVAPPPLNTTRVISEPAKDAQFVKPQPPRPSALPRPATGIPRPVSRIPGPRNVRPVSKSAGQPGRS